MLFVFLNVCLLHASFVRTSLSAGVCGVREEVGEWMREEGAEE